MSKSISRANNASRKSRENHQRSDKLDDIAEQIKESQSRLKKLKADQKELKAGKSKTKTLPVKAQSSSSGSVCTSDMRRDTVALQSAKATEPTGAIGSEDMAPPTSFEASYSQPGGILLGTSTRLSGDMMITDFGFVI